VRRAGTAGGGSAGGALRAAVGVGRRQRALAPAGEAFPRPRAPGKTPKTYKKMNHGFTEFVVQLRHAQRDSSDLRTPLSGRIRASPSPTSAGHRSLLSEMETSSDDDLPPNLSPPLTVLEVGASSLLVH
jgi:hypothetical protein